MRLRLFVAEEYKPLRTVHPLMWALTLGALAMQIAFSVYWLPPPEARQTDYETPLPEIALRVAAFGEPETLAKFLALRIQAFDNQPGVSIPFSELDYDKLGLWLDRIVALDERAEYPHFLMSKVYSVTLDEERRYQTVHWVWRQFLRSPDDRWWWMVHSTNYARHILKDDDLALQMARDLREHLTPGGPAPSWPRQMEAFILENLDAFDSAAAILFNQLESGEITDPQEFVFLLERLEKIVTEMATAGEIKNEQEWRQKIAQLEQLQDKFIGQFDDIEN